MKRGAIFFILIISLILISNSTYSENNSGNVTGTGKAITTDTTGNLGMSITITAFPALSLISPVNGTYVTNSSFLLNYSVSLDTNKTWYSLNGGTNVTINSPTFFNTSEGSQILYLFANNSFGLTSRNVSFFVNSTRFSVLYSKYNGTTKGSSTNFISYTYEQMQNLSNIILENTSAGKILFNQPINLTDDSNFSDNQADLNSIEIDDIYINTTLLPNFNKPATLWFYGLSFSNPQMLVDGDPCPSVICKNISYAGGIFEFNVTSFPGNFSARETPAGAVTTTVVSGGGGGGGGAVTPVKSFSLSKNEIKIKLNQGRVDTEEVIITNNLDMAINVELSSQNLDSLLLFRENNFQLAAKESKIVTLEFVADQNTTPDLYIGNIVIKAEGEEQDILTAVEVQSSLPLFDVSLSIPQEYNYVMPDNDVYAQIEIYNLGELGKEVDVNMEYKILDWRGNEILKQNEELAVNTKISYMKTFRIPANAEFGKYAIYAKATYNNKVASGSAWFNVGKAPTIPLEIATIMLSILIVLVIVIIIVRRKIKKVTKPTRRVDERALKRANIIKR